MPTKKLKVHKLDKDGERVLKDGNPIRVDSGRTYKVDAKHFTWTTDDRFDEPFEVVLPLRIKLGIVRSMNDRIEDADAMAELLGKVVPEQAERFDDMDTNDFAAMYTTWKAEYELLSGSSLGE